MTVHIYIRHTQQSEDHATRRQAPHGPLSRAEQDLNLNLNVANLDPVSGIAKTLLAPS